MEALLVGPLLHSLSLSLVSSFKVLDHLMYGDFKWISVKLLRDVRPTV